MLSQMAFLYLFSMKNIAITSVVVLVLAVLSCTSQQKVASNEEKVDISSSEEALFKEMQGDTITIADEETEYEIIIIEPGFNGWLQSMARPEGFYSQSYLENRNQIYVMNWNSRVLQPQRYNPNLYELQINYDSNIDYGYEVNYKLYNYFIFFQRKYGQRLGPFVPRI